ncbi:MAG TPA: gliding motility-associated C-terminal domain-containing protein, partial [Bacteroidia bacterium]|nr:gliding motility-associated C-terminal domain-containing protein [Bacteroidia bacterium]
VTPSCTSCDTTNYNMGDSIGTSITNSDIVFNYVYSDPGTFAITQYAISQYGCIDSITEYVVIEPDWSFFAPNAFTPNDDNRNDIFYVYGEGIDNSTFEMDIFDRWGNVIFTSKDINKGWDGHANGGEKVAQMDTYVWSVKFRDIKGDPHKFVGHVTMIR